MVPLQLSQVKPDFESLVTQLQLYLAQKETWIDLIPSATGQTLIELCAAVGAFNQYGIESATREAFLDTARRESSVYAIVRMLGVRIARKTPARVECTLSRGVHVETLTIPEYSQFLVQGKPFFNRDPLIWSNTTQSISAVLYEGQIKTKEFEPSGESFRQIKLGEPGFVVSNSDVIVTLVRIDNNARDTWEASESGILIADANAKVYYDSTSGDGDLIVSFGDNNHGKKPDTSHKIEIKYVVTKGLAGSVGNSGQKVTISTVTTVVGVTTSAMTGGADEIPYTVYKRIAPHLANSKQACVTADQYLAKALDFPGVGSASITAERDYEAQGIQPDLTRMNVLTICILPADSQLAAFSEEQWNEFLDYMNNFKFALCEIETQNPVAIETTLNIHVTIHRTAVAELVKVNTRKVVSDLFSRTNNLLSKTIALSDISKAVCDLDGVDYINILNHTADLIPQQFPKNRYFVLTDLTVTTSYTKRI
jgi:hypothetical protein